MNGSVHPKMNRLDCIECDSWFAAVSGESLEKRRRRFPKKKKRCTGGFINGEWQASVKGIN